MNIKTSIIKSIIKVYIPIMLFLVITIEHANASSLFFIEAGPEAYDMNRVPDRTIIYKYNSGSADLESVWELDPKKITTNVYLYSSSNTIIIPEESRVVDKINIFNTNSLQDVKIMDVEEYSRVHKLNFIKNDINYIDLTYSQEKFTGFEQSLINLENQKEEVSNKANSDNSVEVRLSGVLPAYVFGVDDVIVIEILDDGSLESKGSRYTFEGEPVPKNIIQMKDSFGWTMIANESSFRILMSVPVKHGPTQRELLIYNRQTKAWNSVLMEGSRTAPRLINNWIAGVVLETDPETDYKTRKGFPARRCHKFCINS